MTSERFLALIAAYGADARRWPEAERAAAQAFASAHPETVHAALAEADAVDVLLHQSRASGDQPEAVLEAEHTSDACRRVLADAVPHHRRRPDTPGTP